MAIEPAYDAALNDLVKELADVGAVRISERWLLRCHGARNLSRLIWRDLDERFDNEMERRTRDRGDDWEGFWLTSQRTEGGITIVCQQPTNIEPGNKDYRWWVPVYELAGTDRESKTISTMTGKPNR
jgi:hypothetical protein